MSQPETETENWKEEVSHSTCSSSGTSEEDYPSLTSSDEDESSVSRDPAVSLVSKWMDLGMDRDVLPKEVARIQTHAGGMFLLGLGSAYPDLWVTALADTQTLDNKESAHSSSGIISVKQHVTAEILFRVFDGNKSLFYPAREGDTVEVVKVIDKIEKECVQKGRLQVNKAFRMAVDNLSFADFARESAKVVTVANEMHYPEGLDKDGIPSEALQFLLLFFYKVVHAHVSYFGTHNEFLTDQPIPRHMSDNDLMDPVKAKDAGNKFYKKGDYKKAIEMYTAAVKQDFTNCYLYGNRAQCYMNLGQYWEALSDCRRTTFVAPFWYKGYSRAAEACFKMGDPSGEATNYAVQAQVVFQTRPTPPADNTIFFNIVDLKAKIDKLNEKKNADLVSKKIEQLKREKEKEKSVKPEPRPKGTEPEKEAAQGSKGKSKGDGKPTHVVQASGEGKGTLPEPGPDETEGEKQAAQDTTGKSRVEGNLAHPTSSHQQQTLPQPYEPSEVERFQVNVKEGLEAVTLDNMVRAAGKYQAALTLWNQSSAVKLFMDVDNMVTVHYAFGITAVSQDSCRSLILDGLHTFQAMFREKLHLTFPLTRYGLGRALIALYRYAEASDVVGVEITKAMREEWRTVCWPLSQQVIRESSLEVFQEEMQRLRAECRYPPVEPEGVCFEHRDVDKGRAVYTQSPTYAGHVSMSCYTKCEFKFHIACWKVYKSKFSVDKITEKELVDKECPTPDCGSFINCIVVMKPNKKPVEFTSDQKPVRPAQAAMVRKMKPSSQRTIARRLERKELRRQKRAEARQAAISPEALAQQDAEKGKVAQAESALPPTPFMVVLPKEKDPEELKYNQFQKTVKQKKKKEKKEKAVVNVEVNFTENPDRKRIGEFDLEGDEGEDVSAMVTSDSWPSKWTAVTMETSSQMVRENLHPPPPPPSLRNPTESFSQVVASSFLQNPAQSKMDENIKSILVSLLRDILQAEGPQRLEAIQKHEMFQDIREETSRIIQQYGGLRFYFEKNYEFVVRGDFVGIRKDLDKVQQLADGVDLVPDQSLNSYYVNRDSYNPSQPLLYNTGVAEGTNSAWESSSVWPSDGAASECFSERAGEMTLPKVQQELNPSAPEFQPLNGKQKKRGSMNDIDDIELGSRASKPLLTSRLQVGRAMGVLDSFDVSTDDSDEENAPSAGKGVSTPFLDMNDTPFLDMNDIDDLYLEPENDPDSEDVVPQQAFQDGMSPRSSLSDISQAGSDFSTGMLFRTASPSSSASSHRAGRDMGSPFSVRDTNSPALTQIPRGGGDFARQTGSPMLVSPGIDHIHQEKGQGVGESVPAYSDSVSLLSTDVSGRTLGDNAGSGFSSTMDAVPLRSVDQSMAPKPLAPIGGARLGSATAGRSSGTAAGNINAVPSVSDNVGANDSIGRMLAVPASMSSYSAVGDTADPVSVSSWTSGPGMSSMLNAHVEEFTPVSTKRTNSPSTFSSFAGNGTPVSSMAPVVGSALPLDSLAGAYSTSSSLTLGLTSSNTTGGSASMDMSSGVKPSSAWTSSLPLSSSLEEELKPQSYTSSFSSSLPGEESSTSSFLGSDAWTNNSFPSAIRPNEPLISPTLTYPSYTLPRSTPSSTTLSSLSFPKPTWSLGEHSGGVARKAEAEVQVVVETRSVKSSTELTLPDMTLLLGQQEALNQLTQQNQQLLDHIRRVEAELQKGEENRQAALREAERQRNELTIARQQMENMEANIVRRTEEYEARERQLMAELQTVTQKSQLSSLETTNLLQKAALMEEKAMMEKNRAVKAELQLIKERIQNCGLLLKTKHMEIEHRKLEFKMCVLNWQRNNPGLTPPEQQVKDIMTYFQQLREVFSSSMEPLQMRLQEQQTQIMGGKSLDDLEPITSTVPQLPKQPEGLKTSPTGQPIFMPNMAEARPIPSTSPVPAVPETVQESGAAASMPPSRAMGAMPPGMSSMPVPLRPPLSGLRPVGTTPSTGMAGVAAQQPATVDVASARGAPPPLRPIGSLGKGLTGTAARPAPPFAAKVAQSSTTATGADAQAAAAPPKQSSFDRLVTCLQKSFPNCDRETFQQCVAEMRRARNGTLSGLDLEIIVRQVTQMLIARGYRPSKVASTTGSNNNNNGSVNGREEKRTAPPPGINPAWGVERLEGEGMGGGAFVEEEDPCAICTDELSAALVQVLDCGHRFHDHCIRKWFKQQTTCPKCRFHTPLQEDYPVLK